ncbi:MAG: potassium transporter TrkG [Microbacteriaceae bacterium]|nr:potassium transporter TrkG [Microbacteriaceae bacterium]
MLVFTILIFVWGFLLSLPAASRSGKGTNFIDALFTSVSAICVTGLHSVAFANWSFFGQVLIVLGAQIGAIGVLSLATILGLTVTRKLGLKQRLIAQNDANPMRRGSRREQSQSEGSKLGEVRGLLSAVAISTVVIELSLMVLMFPRLLLAGYDPLRALWHSAFLSVTTFTNTGFVPMSDGLARFVGDPYMLLLMSIGVFLGSIGFPVIFSLYRWLVQHGWSTHKRFGLHTKLTLTTMLLVVVFGWILIGILEANNPKTFASQDFWATSLHAFFTSIMTRSGGFSVVNPADMHASTHLVLDSLMFVGGGSASTAGGIKVTTLAVLFLAAFAEARGYADVQAFGRRIPDEVLRLAISVLIWSTTVVMAATIAITHISGVSLDRVLFEVISGFASCGLSTGLSQELPPAGKIILMATVWIGRVGTVTLASAVAATSRTRMFRFPEERPIVG